MRLLRYRVANFRSVVDSGWVVTSDVTALIGENETGKTNLLLPLWKLSSEEEGSDIDLFADLPRGTYHTARSQAAETEFIEAEFSIGQDLANAIAWIAECDPEQVSTVSVVRYYDGRLDVTFPKAPGSAMVKKSALVPALRTAKERIETLSKAKPDAWRPAVAAVEKLLTWATADDQLVSLQAAQAQLSGIKIDEDHASFAEVQRIFDESLPPAFKGAVLYGPELHPEVSKRILDALPKFVYYSNFGTLTARLYLPRVVEDLERPQGELAEAQRAQVRTIRVLFEYLGLSPKEILELGRQSDAQQNPSPTESQIKATARRKEERLALLNAAAASLSKHFREWWQRGAYNFTFSADGDYFTIWVSDDQRPEPIQLESRSQGLQWFFSFFLVFLVEARGEHNNAILLLDEPGVTLHPLAQEDLFRFFEHLSEHNQLIYTAHSPFLVDPDRLSDVRVVFVNDYGETKVSADLRKAERDKKRSKAIFAVDAALALSASQATMRHGSPTIVEADSDQIYLTLCKNALISAGRIAPRRELFFAPAAGTAAISSTAVALGVHELPAVLLDSDRAGVDKAVALRRGAYSGKEDRVVLVGDFLTIRDAEIEDLMPRDWMIEVVDRLYRSDISDELFRDIHKPNEPIVPQIQAFCEANDIPLRKSGWKVDVAAEVARRATRREVAIPKEAMNAWKSLFDRIIALDT